jgi:hypothetical protein
MRLRRIASRVFTIAVLVAAAPLAGCGASGAHRSAAPTGKIEALRQAQEQAQAQIEAEAHRNALRSAREQQAMRREAERESGDRATSAR